MDDARNMPVIKETLTWDGVLTAQSVDLGIPAAKKVLIRINNGANQQLAVTLFHKDGANLPAHCGVDGAAITFNVAATTHLVCGPFEGWPRFGGGRLTVTAGEAPTDETTTEIEIRTV